jgi:hypothetical protein
VAAQARAIADAWSPPGAPESWWLTASTFTTIAEEEPLLDLATAVPPDRLPPLLLAAAVRIPTVVDRVGVDVEATAVCRA